jgi:hypothetical protein
MALNPTQQAVLADLFENDPEFQRFATQRMNAAAEAAEKRASALRSFNGGAKKASKKSPGRPKGSKNKPKETAASTPREVRDWKPKISEVLRKSKDGLLVSEIQAKMAESGAPIAGGTLNTYLYGMKKDGVVKGDGPRGKTRYALVS